MWTSFGPLIRVVVKLQNAFFELHNITSTLVTIHWQTGKSQKAKQDRLIIMINYHSQIKGHPRTSYLPGSCKSSMLISVLVQSLTCFHPLWTAGFSFKLGSASKGPEEGQPRGPRHMCWLIFTWPLGADWCLSAEIQQAELVPAYCFFHSNYTFPQGRRK